MKRTYKYKVYEISKKLKKKELKFYLIRAVISDLRLNVVLRFYLNLYLENLYRLRIRYFCYSSNQFRGLIHFFNVFRMFFRDNALFARYSGIKKSSW
jgi:ribosomal protein S14